MRRLELNMQKIYKLGFWVLLLTAITFFNFWQISKTGKKMDFAIDRQINEKRISSLLISNNNNKRQVEISNAENVVTNEQVTNLLKDTTLVILLTEPKCNKCQEKEIKRLNLLKKQKNFNMIGITTQKRKNILAMQRKINKIDFPIYWIDDTTFYNNLAFDSEFPQIIYVINGKVISAFKPIPFDDEFSEKYYEELLN
ncbi:MAG: hypothetical protein COW71_13505 [Ignavibacteriales bacterium CG18_big_fil_WC_8_21_14_2_50_31_20]|nr:MAG: hypothetical protein COW71_13505 [Ignavibacteriales bacterium CG18_big_fil_WC_8_21_14_2_50_31_20]